MIQIKNQPVNRIPEILIINSEDVFRFHTFIGCRYDYIFIHRDNPHKDLFRDLFERNVMGNIYEYGE